MTQVYFYHHSPDKLATACALLHKAWRARKPVVVYAPNGQLAQLLDRQLWMNPTTGFIPHCMADSPLALETPILLAGANNLPVRGERLLNLADEPPPSFVNYQTILEIVSQTEADRLAARQRASTYKREGWQIEFIDLQRHSHHGG